MSKTRTYWDYLRDIQEALRDIVAFTKNYNFEKFNNDRKTIYAVIRALEIIGEAVKKLPLKLRNNYAHIPWKEIAGMRDILIHEYFGVNTKVIWKTIEEDIPFLKKETDKILNNSQQEKLL